MKLFVTLLLSLLALTSTAQNSQADIPMGKIKVYKFNIESLKMKDGTHAPCAVGYEQEAELFSMKIGDDIFYKIKINNDYYSVLPKPYNGYSQQKYKEAVLDPGPPPASYLPVPKLPYIAGEYLLNLPFFESKPAPQNTTSISQPTIPPQTNLNWQLIGQITVYNGQYHRSISHGEEDITFESENAYLYSAFDGSEMKYKITIPKYGSQYDVQRNGNYNGDKVRYTNNGKRITHIPDVSYIYTHRAGGYYFNVDNAR